MNSTIVQIGEFLNQDTAEKLANRARKAGFPVECVTDGWSIFHVQTRRLDYSEAFGLFLKLQRAGYHPVMI